MKIKHVYNYKNQLQQMHLVDVKIFYLQGSDLKEQNIRNNDEFSFIS